MNSFTTSVFLGNSIKKCLIPLVLILGSLFPVSLNGSYLAGMDINYTILPGNRILVTVSLYRDCGGISPLTNLPINITSSCGYNYTSNIALARTQPLQCYCTAIQAIGTNNGTNCSGGSGNCFEELEYEGIVQLQHTNCADIKISVSECCRNSTITNLVNSGTDSIYVETNINIGQISNTFGGVNSSPVFSREPSIPTICNNTPYVFTQNAYDPDDDSLIYTLIDARASSITNIPYISPMSGLHPIPSAYSPTDSFLFCPYTGDFSFTPTTPGSYVVVVRVDEWRRIPGTRYQWQLIGSTVRDMQLQVYNCITPSSNQPAYFREIDYSVRGTVITPPTTVITPDAQNCQRRIGAVNGSTCHVCPGSDFDALVVIRDPDYNSITGTAPLITSDLLSTFPQVGTNVSTFDVFPSPDDSLEIWCIVHIPAACIRDQAFAIRHFDDNCPIPYSQNITFNIYTSCATNVTTTDTLTLRALGNCNGQLIPTQVTVSDCIGNTVTYTVGDSSNLVTTYSNACTGTPLTASWYLNGRLRMATSYATLTGQGFDILTCDNTVNSSTVSLCGQVFSAGNPVTSGTVLLYQVDSLGAFTLSDSTQLNSNGYCLTADILENYIILVIPNDSTRVPTYFGLGPNNNYLSSLNPADITPKRYGTANLALNISLVNSNNSTNITGTNIFICGLFQGPRSNFRNAFAVLMNMNGEALRSTKVEPNGSFTFRNIASGQYQIKVGYLHYPSTAGNICVGCPVPETLNFRLYNGRITPDPIILGNGVAFDNRTTLTVFPNPTKDNITLKGLQTQDLINVTDLFGRTVLSTSALLETQTLDVAALPAGVYIISTPSTKPAKFVKM